MKKLLLLLVLLLNVSPLLFAQIEVEIIESKILSFDEMVKRYPFNKTTKITLISYNLDVQYPANLKADKIEARDSISSEDFLLIQNLIKHDLRPAQQVKVLNINDICQLADILFNSCKKPKKVYSSPGCFYPRNAILFYNEEGKVFEFMEVCFVCRALKVSNPQNAQNNTLNAQLSKKGSLCTSFYFELEKFFKSNGLQTRFNYAIENSQ